MHSFRASAARLRCDVRYGTATGCSAPLSTSWGSAVARHAFWSSTTNSLTRWVAAKLCETSRCAARPTTRWLLNETSGGDSCSSEYPRVPADTAERLELAVCEYRPLSPVG